MSEIRKKLEIKFSKSNNQEIQKNQNLLVVKKQLLEKYNASEIIKITDDVYWMKDKEFWNINNFVNKKWELLFNVVWIIEDLWVDKYKELLKKLWYEWYVDDNWYYHMIEIKTWKEIPQESIKYYEIFELLAFVDDKLGLYKDNQGNIRDFKKFMKYWKKVYKQIAGILEDAIKENKFISSKIKVGSISPLEYFFYLNTGQIEKKAILKYTRQIFNIEYFRKYYENKWFKVLDDKEFEILLGEWKVSYDEERILFEKYKSYKISLKPSIKNIDLILEEVLPFVEKVELNSVKNKQDQKKIKQRYEELREFLQKKKKELKHIEATKQEISDLENDITGSLA